MGEEKTTARGLAALAALPNLLKSGPLDDLRSIAQGMQVLPELARLLATIEVKVESLDDEVKKMRQAVEAMGGDVGELPPKIDELGHTLHPLRRMGSRFSRPDGAPVDPDEQAGDLNRRSRPGRMRACASTSSATGSQRPTPRRARWRCPATRATG